MTDAFRLSLSVSMHAAPIFEDALEALGGAVVTGTAEGGGPVSLDLYLTRAPEKAEILALLTAAALAVNVDVPLYRLETLPDVDWVSESQKGLPAIRAGRFFLYGSHIGDRPPANAVSLLVDANAAFGTGRHESTFGCLMALDELAKSRRCRRVLDMGAGSGILAMAAAKVWRVPVRAIELDPVAVDVARLNVRLNGLRSHVTVCEAAGYRPRAVGHAGPFDLVFANILAEPLMAMANDLSRHLAPGGFAVLSGILGPQARAVIARHRAAGLVLQTRLLFGDWATLVLRRK
jgi:ribosomal protein L11 methyltransferase